MISQTDSRITNEEPVDFEYKHHPHMYDMEFHYLLPLKYKHGLIQQPAVANCTGRSEESGEDSSGDKEILDDADVEPDITAVELLVRRQRKVLKRKDAIAEMASMLLENPAENVFQLRQLLAFCLECDPDVATTVRRLSMISLTSVFKDIIPSYYIRELTPSEKAVKVSKQVHKLRLCEQTLLNIYKQFLAVLDNTAKVGLHEKQAVKRIRWSKTRLEVLENGQLLSHESLEALAEVAIRCQCELLTTLPHFNYRGDILKAVVHRINSKALGGKVSKMCCEAIEKVFYDDVVGEVSLEAVQLIANVVKSRKYRVKPTMLKTFLCLQLHHVDESLSGSQTSGSAVQRMGKKGRAREFKMTTDSRTKKQRKHLKAERKLKQEMQEAAAEESKEKKKKLQTEILKVVFATYFRVLKNSHHSPLLQPVLEGLARFSHLVNVEYLSDLLSLLHSLIETKGLTGRQCMQCVLTASRILSGQGKVLNIDLRQFYVQLYQSVIELDACSSSEYAELAVNCIDVMMKNFKQVSLQRVLGFVKRLSSVSLQLMPTTCYAVLAVVKQLMQTYSKCEQLLVMEEGGRGVFRPEVPDPEMCQASSAHLWELSTLMSSFDPTTKMYTNYLLKGATLQGAEAVHFTQIRSHQRPLQKVSLSYLPPMSGVPLPLKRKVKQGMHYFSDPGISRELAVAL